MKPMFTPEELAELARFDAEVDASNITVEEAKAADTIDRNIKNSRKSRAEIKRAEYQRRYYEANKDEIAEYQRRYREANKDEIAEKKRRYYEAKKAQRLT